MWDKIHDRRLSPETTDQVSVSLNINVCLQSKRSQGEMDHSSSDQSEPLTSSTSHFPLLEMETLSFNDGCSSPETTSPNDNPADEEEFLTIVKVTPRRPSLNKSKAKPSKSRIRAGAPSQHVGVEETPSESNHDDDENIPESANTNDHDLRRQTNKSCFLKDDSEINNTQKKSVHFNTIHVRTYNTILGDHPCCTNGLPLALGWDYRDDGTLSIDEYELQKRGMGMGASHACRISKLDCNARKRILRGIHSATNEDSKSEETLGDLIEEEARKKDEKRYSEMELRRAERKLYRERQRCSSIVGKRRSIRLVNQFFTT
jgi:hypothetical protein